MTVRAERTPVAAVPIDWVDLDGAVQRIHGALQSHAFFQVSTVNLDFLVEAQRDSEVAAILRSTGLNTPDGFPVVVLGRLAGAPAKGRVTGADLVPAIIELAARNDLTVFLLGGEDGSNSLAAVRLRARFPDLRVEVCEPPRASLEDMDNDRILRHIDAVRPDLLLVAFGHPKQEKWIYRHRTRLPMVAMGVGCSLDLIAGKQRRAPLVMQRLGLEWGFRLRAEPRRLARRYLKDGLWFVGVFLPGAISRRIAKESEPSVVDR
jgi:N-acetylglucosaminyldiphosphoundecaprenol N-acetyl-beta-D-mannosaminyltransferase